MRKEIEDHARRIEKLLDSYSASPVISALVQALAVYVLDPRHGFDSAARKQALKALATAAQYAGWEWEEN